MILKDLVRERETEGQVDLLVSHTGHTCPHSRQGILTDEKTNFKKTPNIKIIVYVYVCNELCLAPGEIIFSLNIYSSVYLPPAVKLTKIVSFPGFLSIFFFHALFLSVLLSFLLSNHPILFFVVVVVVDSTQCGTA